jgi:transcriptional regulator with XRE-family HTH domain
MKASIGISQEYLAEMDGLCVRFLFLFRSSLAKEEKGRKHNNWISHFKSIRKLERMVSTSSIHGSKLFRTSSTDIPDVLTADNYACMFVCNWYYQAFGWLYDENKEETRLN